MSPATSEQQRKLFCVALAMKLGKVKKSYSPEAAKMAKDMDIKTLSDYCHSKVKEG